MDDDEAFLYGDDAPETTPHPTPDLPVGQSVPQPTTQPKGTAPLPPLLPNLLPSFDQTPQSAQAPSDTRIPTEPPQIFLPQSHLTESTHVQSTDVPPPHGKIDDPQNDLNADMDAEGVPDEQEEGNNDDGNDGLAEEEGDEEQDQGSAEDSDEDLDIILEGDPSNVPIPTSSRTSAPPSRFETPRDALLPNRPNEDFTITTEYKPLERVDAKLAEPVPIQPPKTHPIPILPVDPATRQGAHNNVNSHNRLPTPENFPTPATPPAQPPLERKPIDLQVENPIIPSGYDDKDGSALMNFDFDAIPESEKGWKKPGAHLADWFNYGFDETTWRLYVMKQKRMRKEEGWAGNPFAAFATGNIEQAWEGLPPELKDVMMGVIMGNSSGPRNNNHPSQMPASMPSMMVMNPMMQGMEMGGYGMQGMPNMMGGGNPPMNGGHNNPALDNQLNEGANRVIKQDPGGASEQPGEARPLFGDEMDAREQHHHEQQRLQDQLRHMQHMHHMGMGAGFMPGMDLAAMFGNQEHQMFMNGPSFNGMMEMPQMPHLRHVPSPMQQQLGPGPPTMKMPMPQNLKPTTSAAPGNPVPLIPQGPIQAQHQVPLQTPLQGPLQPPPQGSLQPPPQGPLQPPPQGPLQPPPQGPLQPPPQAQIQAPPLAVQTARPESPGTLTSAPTSAPGNVGHVATPGGSPRSVAISSPVSGRGRGARIGRGRGNAQASAFLAAAAARGRGRVISASNSVTPLIPVTATSSPTPLVEAPAQISPPLPVSSTPASSVPSAVEASTERPSVRPVSPLPSNVPTGPRRAVPATNGAPPRGPRAGPGGYFDKDAAGGRGDEGLDYGGGGAGGGGGGGGGGSPRDDRKPHIRRHSHKSERERSDGKEGTRPYDRAEDPSERSRSKSRDKEVDDRESSHKSKSSRHRHRARSKSRDQEYRNNREKGEKDKEDGNNSHKTNRSTHGGRRSRRSRRGNEGGEDKEEDRDPHETGEDADMKEKEKHNNKVKDRERDRERDRDRDRDKDRDNREKDREYDDDAEGDYSAPANTGSRKRKPKEERSNRSKRERAD